MVNTATTNTAITAQAVGPQSPVLLENCLTPEQVEKAKTQADLMGFDRADALFSRMDKTLAKALESAAQGDSAAARKSAVEFVEYCVIGGTVLQREQAAFSERREQRPSITFKSPEEEHDYLRALKAQYRSMTSYNEKLLERQIQAFEQLTPILKGS